MNMNVYVYAYIDTYLLVYTHAHTKHLLSLQSLRHIEECGFMVHIRIHMYMYVHIYIYVYIHIYIYIRTHTHIENTPAQPAESQTHERAWFHSLQHPLSKFLESQLYTYFTGRI